MKSAEAEKDRAAPKGGPSLATVSTVTSWRPWPWRPPQAWQPQPQPEPPQQQPEPHTAPAAASAAGVSTSSARAWCTETIGELRPWVSSGISTPSGSLRSERYSIWFIARPDRSTSMNSGRSFGRQVTSTSLLQVRNHAAGLDARRGRFALEVQRNRDADLLVVEDPLQVDVQHGVLRRVTLHVLEDRRLVQLADLQVEDGRVEALVVEHEQELRVVERQGARLTVATVEDGGNLVRATQAAARTFALGVTELGGEFECSFHDDLQLSSTRCPDRDQTGQHQKNTLTRAARPSPGLRPTSPASGRGESAIRQSR